MNLSVRRPIECSETELTDFHRLVLEGGKVSPDGLPELIKRAALLAFFVDAGTLFGIGAIKNPNHSYKTRVFRQALSPLDPAQYAFELGWVYVQEAYGNRGFSKDIISSLIELCPGKMFATTGAENKAMNKNFKRYGFSPPAVPIPVKMRR